MQTTFLRQEIAIKFGTQFAKQQGMFKIVKLGIGLLIFCFFLVGCGSSTDDNVQESSGNLDSNQSVSQNATIDSAGGNVELKGIATLEFPLGSFNGATAVTVKSDSDSHEIQQYQETAMMSDIGPAFAMVLRVSSPVQPQQAILIHYSVPKDFLQTLEQQNFIPQLFGKFIWVGDDESLAEYEPIAFDFSENILTAKIDPAVFSDEDTHGKGFEAILVLGSIKGDQTTLKKNLIFSKTVSTNSLDGSCQGITLGNPLKSKLTVNSSFGWRNHPISGKSRKHAGVDLKVLTGDDVLAAANGVIESIQFQFDQKTGHGFGLYIIVAHPNGSKTLYAHLLEGSADHLYVGDAVQKGTVIGKADSSGGVTGPHLHFQFSPNGKIIGDNKLVVDPVSCVKYDPVKIVSLAVGTALFHPIYGVPFEVVTNVPPGNGIAWKECLSPNHECWEVSPCRSSDYDPSKIRGCVDFKTPRGSLSVTYRITDKLGNIADYPFTVSWDCCNDPSTANYQGIKLSCYTLGDNTNQCH